MRRTMLPKVRHILRCYEENMPIKEMSRILSLSKNTVKRYIRQYAELGIEMHKLLAMSDAQLETLFYKQQSPEQKQSNREKELEQLLPMYAKRLQKRGVTKASLHQEYLLEHPDGYQKTQFCLVLRRYMHYTKAVGHVEHVAGDQMYVDYAGDKLHIVNMLTGEERPVEVFVAILPCSHYTYCEAVYSQQKDDFIKGCENALHFYGGVPKAIVPDNLKSAVTKPSKVEPVINEDFAAFADHYGCYVYPARAKRPQDKALVENAVKLIYRQIYPATQGKVFDSLEALNEVLWAALKEFNNKKMYQRPYSRYEHFMNVEREYLSDLPEKRFSLKKRKSVTVKNNSYVMLNKHNYSVPKDYIGKKVELVYDIDTVDVFYRFKLVTSHRRDDTPFGFTTKAAHNLPGRRSDYLSSMMQIYDEARQIDEIVLTYLQALAEEKEYPAQAYKSCRGVLSLGERYGYDLLIQACRMANEAREYSFNAVDKLLRQRKKDPISIVEKETAVSNVTSHTNLRGSDYYKSNKRTVETNAEEQQRPRKK